MPQGEVVYPCFRVVPRGWSHALNVCQEVFSGIVTRALDLPVSTFLSDTREPPPLDQGVVAVYVDNFIVAASDLIFI